MIIECLVIYFKASNFFHSDRINYLIKSMQRYILFINQMLVSYILYLLNLASDAIDYQVFLIFAEGLIQRKP